MGISRRSVLGYVVGYAVVAVFLAFCGYYISLHRDELAFVATASRPELSLAAFLILVNLFVNAIQTLVFFRYFGLSLGFTELVAVSTGMCLGNLVLPMRGGTAMIAIYLKKVHGLNMSSFAVIYAGVGLLMALVNTGLALFALAVLYVRQGFLHYPLTILVAILFGFCCYLTLFPPPIRWKRAGVLTPIFEAVNAWYKLTHHRALLAKLAILFALGPFLVMGAFSFIYEAFGAPLPWTAVLVTSTLGNLASLMPLIPGSLGIYDAVTMQIPQIFGLDTARSVAAALSYRVLLSGWTLILGVPGILYMLSVSRAHGSSTNQD